MPSSWCSGPIKAVAILCHGLLLAAPFAAAAAAETVDYDQIKEWERSCTTVQYSETETSYYSGLFKIKVDFNPADFEVVPPSQEGTAFLIDEQQGLLMTALHTLLPEDHYSEMKSADNCTFPDPAPKSLSIQTRVFSPNDPNDNEVVSLEVVDQGWNGCRDTALLKIDPNKLSPDVLRFEISHSWPITEGTAFSAMGWDSVTPDTPTEDVNLTYTKLGSTPDKCQGWLQICCTKGCLLASKFDADGGASGSPLLDDKGRVLGMFLKKSEKNNQTVWAMPMWHIDRELLLKNVRLKGTPGEILKKWAATHTKIANPSSSISNLRFYKALDEFTRSNINISLEPKQLICPILVAAKARGIGNGIGYQLAILAMAYSRRAAAPEQTTRAHAREIGQEQFQLAQESLRNGDVEVARTQLAWAETALDTAVSLYLAETGTDPAATVSSIVAASSEADKENATFIAENVAAVYHVADWNVVSETQTSNVLSAMLREVADTNVAIASLDDTNQTAALKGAALAFWARSVAPANSSAEARSYRTLGDALVRANQSDSAVNAYLQAYLAARGIDTRTARLAQQRLKETSTLPGVTVVGPMFGKEFDADALKLVATKPLLDFATDPNFRPEAIADALELRGYDG